MTHTLTVYYGNHWMSRAVTLEEAQNYVMCWSDDDYYALIFVSDDDADDVFTIATKDITAMHYRKVEPYE